MAQNITLLNAQYQNVPAVTLPKTGGGTAKFTDVTDTTATAAKVLKNFIFFDASGNEQTGTAEYITIYSGTGAPSASLGNEGDIYLRTD